MLAVVICSRLSQLDSGEISLSQWRSQGQAIRPEAVVCVCFLLSLTAETVRQSASLVRDKRSKQLNSKVSAVEQLDRLATWVTSLENLLQPVDGSIFPFFCASLFDDNAGD